MNEIITTSLTGLFCTTISSIVTFFLTKRKYSAEVDAQQLQNVGESFELYKKMMDQSIQAQDARIKTLEKENEDLRQQVKMLQEQVIDIIKLKVTNSSKRKSSNGSTGNKKL